jgi:hypothetical protein
MKNYEKPSQDLVDLFNSVLDDTSIPDWIDFEIRVDNKQKKTISKIRKLDDLVVNLTDQINFAIVVNERAFYMLSEDQQKMELRDQIEGVVVDENDKISLEKPSFTAHPGLLEKYGYDAIKGLYETRNAIFIKIKEEDDAIKAQTKGKRGRKKRNDSEVGLD